MGCECGGKTEVIDSRSTYLGIRRRRRCKACDSRFSTYEIGEDAYGVLLATEKSRKLLTQARAQTNSAIDTLEELSDPGVNAAIAQAFNRSSLPIVRRARANLKVVS
jgi:transcriptional regulator NrdR family protein